MEIDSQMFENLLDKLIYTERRNALLEEKEDRLREENKRLQSELIQIRAADSGKVPMKLNPEIRPSDIDDEIPLEGDHL